MTRRNQAADDNALVDGRERFRNSALRFGWLDTLAQGRHGIRQLPGTGGRNGDARELPNETEPENVLVQVEEKLVRVDVQGTDLRPCDRRLADTMRNNGRFLAQVRASDQDRTGLLDRSIGTPRPGISGSFSWSEKSRWRMR